MERIGLDRIRLDRLGWIGLDWIGLVRLDWTDWVGLERIALAGCTAAYKFRNVWLSTPFKKDIHFVIDR